MSDPDEAKELRLVNNVELKIALAEGDDKLQRLLNLYLPPLLLKLASPHASVRNKVAFLDLSQGSISFVNGGLTRSLGDFDMPACEHSYQTTNTPSSSRSVTGAIQRPPDWWEASASSEFRLDVCSTWDRTSPGF